MPLLARLTWTLCRAIGALPLQSRYLLAWPIGRLFALVPTRDRRIAQLQLDRFLGAGSARPAEVYTHLARSALESLSLPEIAEAPGVARQLPENGMELFKERSHGRGVILLSAHLGNWELLGSYLAQRVPLSVIGRELKNPVFQGILARLRARYGARTLWRAGKLGVKQILGELNAERVVVGVIDQDTRVGGKPIPFFGAPAFTPTTLVEIAKKRGTPLVTGFCIRTAPGRFDLHFAALDSTGTTEQILTEYHRRLEELIRAHPEQWVWFHKRWRTIEGRGRLSSREYITYLRDLATQP